MVQKKRFGKEPSAICILTLKIFAIKDGRKF